MQDLSFVFNLLLTQDVHSGLGCLGSAGVGTSDLVLSMIRPHGLLDEQNAVLALRLDHHPFLVGFGFVFGPFDLRLRSAGHHGRKLERLAGLDDHAVLHRVIKVHRRRLCRTRNVKSHLISQLVLKQGSQDPWGSSAQ